MLLPLHTTVKRLVRTHRQARAQTLEIVTPWYPPAIRPTLPGMYEICHTPETGTIFRAYWNGALWAYTPLRWETPFINQSWYWRGLAEDPATIGRQA